MPPEKVAVLIITGLIAVLLSVTVLKSDGDPASSATLAEAGGSPASSAEERGRLDLEDLRQGRGRTPRPPSPPARREESPFPPSGDEVPEFFIHTLASGETPGKLAQRYYGRESLYRRILEANPEIVDPTRIRTGTEIRIPTRFAIRRDARPEGGPPPGDSPDRPAGRGGEPSGRWHEVRQGETLSGIAKRYYGRESDWERVYGANRAALSSPDKLKPGIRLVIP